MRLSIIIPVYNVEEYLPMCLDSVLHQDIPHSEYEIIVVNDGSPDDSDKVVQNYLTKYSNIKYLHQDNKGPGGARNNGINHSEGDYIWFVDGDDTIAPNCVRGLLDYAEKLDLDFCEFPHNEIIGNETKLIGTNADLRDRYLDSKEYIKVKGFPYTACFNITKREVLTNNNLRVVEGIYHEDWEFNIRVLFCCQKISYYHSEMGIYNYVINREGSTMTNTKLPHTLKRIDSYIYIIKSIKENFKYNPQQRDYSFFMHRMANYVIVYTLLPLIKESAIPNKQEFFRNMVVSKNLTYNIEVLNGIPKFKFWIFSLFRSNYRASLFTLSLFQKLTILKQEFRDVLRQ